eukprot:scaffold71831_cov33-Phaeocystis_antarctica.AAC.1
MLAAVAVSSLVSLVSREDAAPTDVKVVAPDADAILGELQMRILGDGHTLDDGHDHSVPSTAALQPDGFLQSPLQQSTPVARKISQWGRQWTVQPGGLNCYDGHGAPGASGQPHSRSIRLDECEKECRSLPGCGAVVVKFESNPSRVLAAAGEGPAAALVDCYLREE